MKNRVSGVGRETHILIYKKDIWWFIGLKVELLKINNSVVLDESFSTYGHNPIAYQITLSQGSPKNNRKHRY